MQDDNLKQLIHSLLDSSAVLNLKFKCHVSQFNELLNFLDSVGVSWSTYKDPRYLDPPPEFLFLVIYPLFSKEIRESVEANDPNYKYRFCMSYFSCSNKTEFIKSPHQEYDLKNKRLVPLTTIQKLKRYIRQKKLGSNIRSKLKNFVKYMERDL